MLAEVDHDPVVHEYVRSESCSIIQLWGNSGPLNLSGLGTVPGRHIICDSYVGSDVWAKSVSNDVAPWRVWLNVARIAGCKTGFNHI